MSICWTKENKDSCVASMNRFEDESINGHNIQPHYASFNELLKLCRKEYEVPLLLDIGTGSGRLSQFCKDFHFYGADLPWIINGVAQRNNPQNFYSFIDIEEDELAWISKYDVLVLNGVIDIMERPLIVLKRILTHAKKYVLIHRQEITETGETISHINDSYGSSTYHSIVNRGEWNDLLEEMGFEIIKENSPMFGNWENGGSSFLLFNKNYLDNKYGSHPIRQLRNRIQQSAPLKIILGAGDVMHTNDFISTNIEEIDAENANDFSYLIGEKKVDVFFSEHMVEHLKYPEKAFENMYNYLKDNGVVRIAIPDGYHPDKQYIESVKVGGHGAGSDDHHNLFTHKTITRMLEAQGFKVELLEYWDEKGIFHSKDWSDKYGRVNRSIRYDERNINGKPVYTSLIVDAKKK